MPDRTFYVAATLTVILAVVVVLNSRVIFRYVTGLPVYRVADYDPGLTRMAAKAKPLMAALDRYHRLHGRFPPAASQLTPYLRPGLARSPALEYNVINGCAYRKHKNSDDYELWVIFSRDDPRLHYESKGSTWRLVYDDGSADKPVRLNP
jgi:hypothetical protein